MGGWVSCGLIKNNARLALTPVKYKALAELGKKIDIETG